MLWTTFILFIIWLVLASVYQEQIFDTLDYIVNKIKKGNK